MTIRSRQLSSQAHGLLRGFSGQPGVERHHLQALANVIVSSPMLTRQIDSAVDHGLLRRIEVLDAGANASGEYHASERMIKLPIDLLTQPAMTALTLGHETQHALNSPVVGSATAQFHAAVSSAAANTQDYTTPVQDLIRANRWDEASANLAGWNALVGHLGDSQQSLRLKNFFGKVPAGVLADFVAGSAFRPMIHPDLRANGDFTIPLTPSNIEAMAQKFFDKRPRDVKLGARGTSDYANYYAAWAVGVAASAHIAANPRRPMRIDLERIGLSRRLMEENGIDLNGGWQQSYIDQSTRPPTRDVFHHTMGTFAYVPPKARIHDRLPDHSVEAVRLAMIGFPRPATEAIEHRLTRNSLQPIGYVNAGRNLTPFRRSKIDPSGF